jgi:hypothetical protein
MKSLIFVLAFGMLSYAQQNTPQSAQIPGCGPAQESFSVTAINGAHPTAQPDPGKALIYVFQDDTGVEYHPRPTTRIGMDGKWVGATHSNTYLYSAVDPGEHHLCVRWQGIGMSSKVVALHLTAVDGHSYYFRVKDTWTRNQGKQIEFTPIDSDEGQLLASKAALSTSLPKK